MSESEKMTTFTFQRKGRGQGEVFNEIDFYFSNFYCGHCHSHIPNTQLVRLFYEKKNQNDHPIIYFCENCLEKTTPLGREKITKLNSYIDGESFFNDLFMTFSPSFNEPKNMICAISPSSDDYLFGEKTVISLVSNQTGVMVQIFKKSSLEKDPYLIFFSDKTHKAILLGVLYAKVKYIFYDTKGFFRNLYPCPRVISLLKNVRQVQKDQKLSLHSEFVFQLSKLGFFDSIRRHSALATLYDRL